MSETYVNDDRAFDPNKYVGVPRDTDPNHSEKYLAGLERGFLMQLWTIQPPEVYHMVMDTGVYRCDPFQSGMLQSFDESKVGIELDQQFAESYDWLVRQMEKRIGPRPKGVIYPVWAWYQFAYQKKPDLRRERWSNGNPGEKQACILLDVPEREVLLSDFGNWHHVLNHWPILMLLLCLFQVFFELRSKLDFVFHTSRAAFRSSIE